MNKTLRSILQFTFFLALGIAIISYIYISLENAYLEDCQISGNTDCSFSQKIFDDFRKVNGWWIGLVMILFMFSNWSRATRWIMLVEAMGYKVRKVNAFFTIMLGYFANMGLPRMGEFIRAGSFARYEKIPVDKVMGTIVTDRLFDVFSLLIIIFLALTLEFDMFWGYLSENAVIPGGANLGPWLIGSMMLAGILALIYHEKLISLLPGKLSEKVQAIADGVKEGVLSVRKLKSTGGFLVHSALIWILYYLMTYLCFFSFPATSHLSMTAGLIVFVFGSLGMVIPTPGGLGSYHYLVMVALGLYGISDTESFSFAFILYLSIAVLCNVIFGLIALLFLPLYNRKVNQSEE